MSILTSTAPSTPSATPARYVVEGLLPSREVSILAGASGVGKSTLIFQLVAAISNGEDDFLGHRIAYPQTVGYLAADRTWDSYTELASRVGLDLSRIQTCSLVDDESIDVMRLERDPMDLLLSLLGRFRGATLIIVDPMVLFLGVDPNRYHEVAPRLIRMGRWCRRNSFTILATHHATKARTDYSFLRPQDRVSGSSALLGFTSSQLFLAGADEIRKPYSEFVAVNHNAPPESIKLSRGPNGIFQRWEPQDVNGALAATVLTAVAKGATTKTQLQTQTRIDPATLEGLLEAMVQAELLIAAGKGTVKLAPPRGSQA